MPFSARRLARPVSPASPSCSPCLGLGTRRANIYTTLPPARPCASSGLMVRLAEGRARLGGRHTWGVGPGSDQVSDPHANLTIQQGSPVPVQWDRAKRQCRWTPWTDRTFAWRGKRCHSISLVSSGSSLRASQSQGSRYSLGQLPSHISYLNGKMGIWRI